MSAPPPRPASRPDDLRLGSEVRQRRAELASTRHGPFDYVELSPLSPGEERRRWFEAPPGGETPLARRALLPTPTAGLSEEQRQRLSEDIEAKWKEMERLPLRETKQLPLTCLVGGGRSRAGGDGGGALDKQVQSLKMQLEKAKKELETRRGGSEGGVSPGLISQVNPVFTGLDPHLCPIVLFSCLSPYCK
ncbi:hypothetical protein FKM82_025742 [Ascaphus truei]